MSITLIAVRNPQWQTVKTERLDSDGNVVNDEDGNPIMDIVNDDDGNPMRLIQCEAQWSHLGDDTQEWLPFAATSWDVEQHGRDLYNAIVAGDHGAIAEE
jgi:hypothetical protein